MLGVLLADVPDHFEKCLFLQQGFAARDDGPRAVKRHDPLRGVYRIHLDRDIGLMVFAVSWSRVLHVWPRSSFKIPGVVGVTPTAVQVAAGRTDENRWHADAGTFALEGVENFGAVTESCEFHSPPIGITDQRGWTLKFLSPIKFCMSIITGRGDSGDTDLLFGRRIAKSSLRIEVLGNVDELNAALGLARAAASDPQWISLIDQLQERLVGLMGQLACLPEDDGRYAETGYAAITQADLDWVTEQAHGYEAQGIKFTGWARPGAEGSLARAGIDFSRAVARRAERSVLVLHESGEPVSQEVRLFFNRLSDLLWILARVSSD